MNCLGNKRSVAFASSSGRCCGTPQVHRHTSSRSVRLEVSAVAMVKETDSSTGENTSSSRFLRPHLLRMAPYTPIEPFEVLSARYGRKAEDIIKLDANENPYGPPPEVRTALANMAFPHIYPDPETRALRRALSEAHNIPMEHLLVSDDTLGRHGWDLVHGLYCVGQDECLITVATPPYECPSRFYLKHLCFFTLPLHRLQATAVSHPFSADYFTNIYVTSASPDSIFVFLYMIESSLSHPYKCQILPAPALKPF